MTSFNEIQNKTIEDITIDNDKTEVLFKCSDGSQYKMYHSQDCCEDVYVEEIIGGDLKDLIGQTITEASERTQDDNDVDYGDGMWTFYNIKTHKDDITIRWYGTSNGYYSISVDFERI